MREIPEMTRLDIAFGNIKHMPKYEEIPSEFKNFNNRNKWSNLVSTIFFKGAPGLTLTAKEGVDAAKAKAAIMAILSSFEPKHEHKEAACAYLFSEWFEDYQLSE